MAFSQVAGPNSEAFSAIPDSGCSVTCTNNMSDFIPGTVEHMDKPVQLGGIGGDLMVTVTGRVHWETLDKHGQVVPIQPKAIYHLDLPTWLLSPQAFLRDESQNLEDHFRIHGHKVEWHMDGQHLLTMGFDNSFLPRITLFPKGKAESSLQAMVSVVDDSNRNLSVWNKIWMRWHIRLGHLGFHHIRKLGLGGFLDKHALGLTSENVCDPPHCAACQYGKQTRTPDHTTVQSKHPQADVEGSLKQGQLRPGDRVFCDQLESRVRGRLLHTVGHEQD